MRPLAAAPESLFPVHLFLLHLLGGGRWQEIQYWPDGVSRLWYFTPTTACPIPQLLQLLLQRQQERALLLLLVWGRTVLLEGNEGWVIVKGPQEG